MTDQLDEPICIVFADARNGKPDLLFIEVENMRGQSIKVGEWENEIPGNPQYSRLKITARGILKALGVEIQPADPLRTHHQSLEDIPEEPT